MNDSDAAWVRERIGCAFATRVYPGDWNLVGTCSGEEPVLTEAAFRGKTDWRLLDGEFLGWAPERHSCALTYFSDEAFRFYLPAYLVADVVRELEGNADPLFDLTYYFSDDPSGLARKSPRIRGGSHAASVERQRQRLSGFSCEETAAIVAYLEYTAVQEYAHDQYAGWMPPVRKIKQALERFWYPRAASLAA